jgi:hypothetical protein
MNTAGSPWIPVFEAVKKSAAAPIGVPDQGRSALGQRTSLDRADFFIPSKAGMTTENAAHVRLDHFSPLGLQRRSNPASWSPPWGGIASLRSS